LILGVYLSAQENNIEHIVKEFSSSRKWDVKQKWAAVGGVARTQAVNNATSFLLEEIMPKFIVLNRLLANEILGDYDFVLISDDDISLPDNFLDNYLDLVLRYGFALAQPARTHQSYIDHHFVAQMEGLVARRTRFVEIGPLISIRRDFFSILLPFDETSPMGWGYDFVWPCLVEERGLRMGIIDATPVEHSLRKPVAYYSYKDASGTMEAFLSGKDHLSRGEAYTIIESFAE
jgi:hypothetical protein